MNWGRYAAPGISVIHVHVVMPTASLGVERAHFCLHITEVALAISNALDGPAVVEIESRFDAPEPMPWATQGGGTA